MAAIEKSSALKRVPVSPIEEIVDTYMELLPAEVLDLSQDADRQKVRLWMVRVIGRVVQDNALTYAEAARRAIEECGELAKNPKYYEERKKRRTVSRKERLTRDVFERPRIGGNKQ